MPIAATFNRGKYMYKRRGLCRASRAAKRDLLFVPPSCIYCWSSNLFGLFPKNKSSQLLLLDFTEADPRPDTIINIFITIQYCGFMQTSGSSGGESVASSSSKRNHP